LKANWYYTVHHRNLRFCKTILQIVFADKRFASILNFWRFTEDFRSAVYAGAEYNKKILTICLTNDMKNVIKN